MHIPIDIKSSCEKIKILLNHQTLGCRYSWYRVIFYVSLVSKSKREQKAQTTTNSLGFLYMENYRQKRYKVKKDNRVKELTCFRCNTKIVAPDDYLGNIYTLLEVHYNLEHSIDLKTMDWDKFEENENDKDDEDLW